MMIEESIKLGIQHKATDIHICPSKLGYLVKFRINGQLTELHQDSLQNSTVNRLKMLANLDLSETRRCQEGQFSFQIEDQLFFIRISIINTKQGEKVALRILPSSFKHSIDTLNLPSNIHSALRSSLKQTNGIIIVCGATGAGKTTTLYACLQQLNTGKKSIFTIEDPIEFTIKDFYQCEPNHAIDLTPQALLKGFLRQDPDIIFIGELRDKETAQLALTAALTGHLVLTTLHSNSAYDVIQRLQSWEVDCFAFVSSVRMLLHQTMLYSTHDRQPRFSALLPNWKHTIPSNYTSLLNRSEYWTCLEGSLNE